MGKPKSPNALAYPAKPVKAVEQFGVSTLTFMRVVVFTVCFFSELSIQIKTTSLFSFVPSDSINEEESIMEDRPPKVAVFYNLFVKSRNDTGWVSKLTKQQLQKLHGAIEHYGPLHIYSIGAIENVTLLQLFESEQQAAPKNNGSSPQVHLEHHETGDESLTLHNLWKFCRRNSTSPTQKVAYLHSKGSFHHDAKNDRLRGYLTKGVLSEECRTMPLDLCNVCSSRMSPLPHPHTAGNMWLATCNYIAKLKDPLKFAHDMERVYIGGHRQQQQLAGNACVGTGRYSQEHWVHSHPEVMPCDLDNSSSFTWSYDGIPKSYTIELHKAPRWPIARYRKGKACGSRGLSKSNRLREYELLFNETPPPTWFGWDLYEN